MNNIIQTQPLPLFEFYYKPVQVDAELANQLVVYRYPLAQGNGAKEHQLYIEQQLAGYRFAFLLRTHATPRGLFVALHSEHDTPPQVLAADKDPLIPERVYYSDAFAPIWIRLIFRRMSVWNRLCSGYHRGGCPLLVIDSWTGQKQKGIEALRLDCSSFDADADGIARIVPFYEGVSLIGVPATEAYDPKREYWEYDTDNVLHRYLKVPGIQPSKALYKVYQPKKRRVAPDFLDLTSVEKFQQSRPVILLDIVQSFIEHAARYGFSVQQRVLNLQPGPALTTQYTDRKKGSAFSSITYATAVEVIDLRVGQAVSAQAILSLFQDWLAARKIPIRWQLLPKVTPETVADYSAQPPSRILVLIDQLPDMPNDRYVLTRHLSQNCAVQHLQVNPHAVAADPIKLGLLKEYDVEGLQVLLETPNSTFFAYTAAQLQSRRYRKEMEIKLDVVLKELEIKNLLHDQQAKIHDSLPRQADTLTPDIALIADGYLFTVEQDRPVIIPFQLQPQHMQALCDERLQHFDTSVLGLIELLSRAWPSMYQRIDFPELAKNAYKLTRFLKNIVLVLQRNQTGEVSIVLQEYGQVQRYMMPCGLQDTLARLESLTLAVTLPEWFIDPQRISELTTLAADLVADQELAVKAAEDFLATLTAVITAWNEHLKVLHSENTHSIAYPQLKKAVLARFREQTQYKTSSTWIKTLDMLLTRHFKRSLRNPRIGLNKTPSLQAMYFDAEQHIFTIGSLTPLQYKLARQPSIRQWQPIQGQLDVALIFKLLDADWVRMNQLPGNPYPLVLIKRWQEIHAGQALLADC